MGLFSRSKKQSTYHVLIDVESGSVAGSWVKLTQDMRPEILYTKRIEFKVAEQASFESLVASTRRALLELGTYLVSKAPGAPELVHVYMASPWYAAQVRTMHYNKNKPFIFTEKLAHELVQRELTLFEQGKVKEWRAFTAEHYTPLEHIVIDTQLNGYSVAEPFSRKTERVTMRAWFSMAPHHIMDVIEKTLHASFHADVEFRTTAYGAYHVLTHQRELENYVYWDVHAETSDGIVVKQGVVTDVFSVPVGTHSIIRRVAEKLGLSFVQAKEQLTSYHSNMLAESTHNDVEDALDTVVQQIGVEVHKVCESLTDRGLLPHDMYVLADTSTYHVLSEILQRADFKKYTTLQKNCVVHPVNFALVQGSIVDHERTIDMRLILQTLFINALTS